MFCNDRSIAFRSYRKDVLRLMALYAVILIGSSWLVKHNAGSSRALLYFWSVLPAVPVIGVMVRMGRYLQEESDEYQRLLVMQSIVVGTGALLGTLVVNDFVRAFAHGGALPPFWSFLVFCAGMGLTQAWQKFRNRVTDDDEPAA